MRILVTGGSGKLGRATVRDLAAHGHEVVNIDVTPPKERIGLFTRVDLTDYGQVLDAMLGIDAGHSGLDAVVHLAAIPGPSHSANVETYRNNVLSSFNVFHAARKAGIRKVVYASSETLLGVPFETPPPYVPVDEDYESRPEWVYALSKKMDETLAAELCRWDPALSMIGLRFSNVMEPADYIDWPAHDADASLRKWNLWSYIDSRDGAQAIRRALESPLVGHDVFIIAAADTVMSRPNAELLAEIYPGVPVKRPFGPNESLLSSAKARAKLGFEPEYRWREERDKELKR